MNPIPVLLLILAVCAEAAEWKVRHLNANDPIREGGPIPIRLEITNPNTQPVEGRIECVVHINGQMVAEHTSQPLVLNVGEQVVSQLLPSIGRAEPQYERGYIQRTATLRFVSAAGVEPLGERLLPYERGRRVVFAHVTDRENRFQDEEMSRAFSLAGGATGAEDPEAAAEGERTGPFSTIRSRSLILRADELPAHPVGLCAYDCIVLHPEVLTALRSRQLEAIAQWVDSGGWLIVIATRTGDLSLLGASEPLLTFFQRLAADSPASQWNAGAGNNLAPLEAGPVFLHTGCGRAAILPSYKALNRDVRVRTLEHLCPENGGGERQGGEQPRGKTEAIRVAAGLQSVMLPTLPRPIPAGTIVVWMIGFTALVVVGDYLLLGWLRRRKWTWITFPLMSVAAAGGMLAFTQSRMNEMEQTGTLRVVDLGSDGRNLREARFGAILPSQSRSGTFTGRQTAGMYWGVAEYDSYSERAFIQTVGNPSGTCTASMPLTQWTPAFTYHFSPVGEREEPGIQWDRWKPTDTLAENVANGIDPTGTFAFAVMGDDETRADGASDDPVIRMAISDLLHHAKLASIRGSFLPPKADEFPSMRAHPYDGAPRTLLLALRRQGTELLVYRKMVHVAPGKDPTQ